MLRSLLCDIVWYGVCSVLSVLLSRFVLVREDGRSVGTTLSEFQPLCSSYCVLGAVPMVGRRLRLSVPWSLKMTLREEGRPMGPATPRAFDSSG